MLRVVLCIICLHPFLWVFLFALLYHTVKDFFVLILLKTCEFCIFWTVYRFRGGAGCRKKAATGRSFLQFIILDDGGAGGEVGFFFVKKSEFLLAFCVVSACAQKHGFAGTFVAIWKAFDEKKIGLAAVPLILQEVICLDEGAFVFLWIVVKNEVIGIEEGFEIAHEADAAFDFAEIPALVSVGV